VVGLDVFDSNEQRLVAGQHLRGARLGYHDRDPIEGQLRPVIVRLRFTTR
jgi:hypothetical protein